MGTVLTNISGADIPRRMGRPPLNEKSVTVVTRIRITLETKQRIEALVDPNGMAQFIREAISRELARREKRG